MRYGCSAPIFSLFSFPCAITIFSAFPLVDRILDDVEVFEKQKAFELEELVAIADFYNYLIYETVLLVPDRKLTCFRSCQYVH